MGLTAHTRILASLAAAIVLTGLEVAAQRLIVETTALAVDGVPGRVSIHGVDMARESVLPGPFALPGTPPSRPVLTADYRGLFVLSGNVPEDGLYRADRLGPPNPYRRAFLSAYSTVPLQPRGATDFPLPPGWRIGSLVAGGDTVYAMAEPSHTDGAAGYVFAFAASDEGVILGEDRWPLAGAPVALAIVRSDPLVLAVLCRASQERGAHIRRFNLSSGRSIGEDIIIGRAAEVPPAEPVAMAPSAEDRLLFVLTADGHRTGDTASRLHAFSAETGELLSILDIPGAASVGERPLTPRGPTGCWVATRTPGTGFAHIIGASNDSGALQRAEQRSFTDVHAPLAVTTAPNGIGVAIGASAELHVWPDGENTAGFETFPQVIRALAWTDAGLYAGAGNTLFKIDPESREIRRSVSFQSGVVTGIRILPPGIPVGVDDDGDGFPNGAEERYGLSPQSADTDGDGIHDGADPQPLIPSPRFDVPPVITFHGEAVGREVQSFVINPSYGENVAWGIDYAAESMPWLIIQASQIATPSVALETGLQGGAGTLPVMVTMAVDPTKYPAQSEYLEGELTVHMTGVGEDKRAAGSPARAVVRVLPVESELRRVLWIRERREQLLRHPDDPNALKALADLLGAAPHYFSHEEVAAPYLGPLQPYQVVVVDARAAARGAVTRQALLDYVAAGGALLFLGEHLPDPAGAGLERWLAPLGIQIDTASAFRGSYPTGDSAMPVRYLDTLAVDDGATIRSTGDDLLRITGPGEEALILLRNYGFGRIALLAAATPLESHALRSADHRRFAVALFEWLAGARKERADRDGDGLPDDTEDANGNGIADPGETDYLHADTDDDGLADGVEDANRNGDVDDGETDPRNPDSDGDGIHDGADQQPLPPIDAPRVASIDPGAGPGEGGTPVVLQGRNFMPDSRVWFGSRLANDVTFMARERLSAMTPASMDETQRPVVVRVTNPSSGLEGELPAGYRYGPRSTVRVALETVRVMRRAGQMYSGRIQLRLTSPPDVGVGRTGIIVQTEPPRAVDWLRVQPNPALQTLSRTAGSQATGTGAMGVLMSEGDGGPVDAPVVTLVWRARLGEGQDKAIRFVIHQAFVASAATDVPLNVEQIGTEIDFTTAPLQGRPIPDGAASHETGPASN